MLVSYKFNGRSIIKYAVIVVVVKLTLLFGWIMASIPLGIEIINHIESFINDDANISLIFLLKKIGMIGLYFIVCIVVEAIIAFGIIFPIVKNELDNEF